MDIANTGGVAGAEGAQLYLSYPPAANEPPRQLRGFEKLWLLPGQEGTIRFEMTARAVSIWDAAAHVSSLTRCQDAGCLRPTEPLRTGLGCTARGVCSGCRGIVGGYAAARQLQRVARIRSMNVISVYRGSDGVSAPPLRGCPCRSWARRAARRPARGRPRPPHSHRPWAQRPCRWPGARPCVRRCDRAALTRCDRLHLFGSFGE